LELDSIGILGTIAMIPFILKIFLGLLSDKVNLFGKGHRKPYILIGLAIQVISLVIVSLIDPGTNFGLFVLAAFFVPIRHGAI
jgi:PAT family beta-lactamase induction signal transducer AmpG